MLYAEPHGVVHAYGFPPNDPFYGYQWHLFDQGHVGAGSVASNFGVNVPEAWTKSTGSGAVLAVIDTGVA